MENWRDIRGYEGLYQVSNEGRVKSLKWGKEKILKAAKNNMGYLYVVLWKDGKQAHKLVHRLVAEVFIPNPNHYKEVNHKDECKTMNCVENLEWCDRKYNINYGTRTEKCSRRIDQIDKVTGEVIRQWESTAECGRSGFDYSGVSRCARGKLKQYKGYIWKYVPM
jgi:hypothetical protein